MPESPSKPPRSPSLVRKAAADPHGSNSDVYRWLRRKYKQVLKALDQHDPSWRIITELMIADGVTGRFGATPNPNSVCRVWLRVCRDVAGKQKVNTRELHRKAQHASHTQQQVACLTQRAPTRPTALPLTASSRFGLDRKIDPLPGTDASLVVNNENCTPEEALAGLRRILDHRSGR